MKLNTEAGSRSDGRLKCLYLISEIECLSAGTGAYYHIQHGLNELGKYYNITLLPVTKKKMAEESSSPAGNSVRGTVKRKVPFKTTVKWFYLLISRNLDFLTWRKAIKRERPDFYMSRASYLNFKGLWISKILSIPHFYEVNGAFYLEAQRYFPKWLAMLSKKFERWAYRSSTHVFFVGGIGRLYGLTGSGCTDVQNGIEDSFPVRFEEKRVNITKDRMINVVFIGHAMKHHGLHVLASASGMLEDPAGFTFHFVGTNYESMDLDFPSSVNVVFHGQLNHDQIAALLLHCDIGVLPLTVSFSSAVKLFMYGAAKLLLVIPDVPNLKHIFSEDEVVFFQNGDAVALAGALNSARRNWPSMEAKAYKAYQKVNARFLWSEVFREEAEIINRCLSV